MKQHVEELAHAQYLAAHRQYYQYVSSQYLAQAAARQIEHEQRVARMLTTWRKYSTPEQWPLDVIWAGVLPAIFDAVLTHNTVSLSHLVCAVRKMPSVQRLPCMQSSIDMINLKAYVRCYPFLRTTTTFTAYGKCVDHVHLFVPPPPPPPPPLLWSSTPPHAAPKVAASVSSPPPAPQSPSVTTGQSQDDEATARIVDMVDELLEDS